MSRRPTFADPLPTVAVALALASIAVVGRWGQPDWCVTPLAAVGLLAGYALPRGLAIATPLVAMALSDLALPGYGSLGVGLTVYAAMGLTPLGGRVLRRPIGTHAAGAARLAAVAVAPATVFYLTTNLAVWVFQTHYATTFAGLAECYAAALPFYRRMLIGDAAYTAVLFAAALAAGAFSLRGVTAARGSQEAAA